MCEDRNQSELKLHECLKKKRDSIMPRGPVRDQFMKKCNHRYDDIPPEMDSLRNVHNPNAT